MRYIATGRVLPERAAVRFGPMRIERPDGAPAAIVTSDASQITVTLDDPEIDGFVRAWIVAEQYALMVTTALGFALGCGYSVEITQVVEEDGSAHVFGVQIAELEFPADQRIVERALRLSGENVFFRLALRDYARAITDVADCATYCFRVIEAIQHAFPGNDDAARWTAMHEALGTNADAIRARIQDYATPIRHGNWMEARVTTSAIRFDMLTLTREILSKFLDHAYPAVPPEAEPAQG